MIIMDVGIQTDSMVSQDVLNLSQLQDRFLLLLPCETENLVMYKDEEGGHVNRLCVLSNPTNDVTVGLQSQSVPLKHVESERTNLFNTALYQTGNVASVGVKNEVSSGTSAGEDGHLQTKSTGLGRSHSLKGSGSHQWTSSSFKAAKADISLHRRASAGPVRSNRSNHHARGTFSSNDRQSKSPNTTCTGPDLGEQFCRQASTTLSIPSRQASVRSTSSGLSRSYSLSGRGSFHSHASNNYYPEGREFPDLVHNSSFRSQRSRPSRSNSISFSITREGIVFNNLKGLPPKDQRHKKAGYAVVLGVAFILMVALLCIFVSLHGSKRVNETWSETNLKSIHSVRAVPPNITVTTRNEEEGDKPRPNAKSQLPEIASFVIS